MGLTLYVSNQLEVLLDLLARTIKEDPLPPLVPEIVVSPSQGMERWLNLRLAEHHGIAGNYLYLFPHQLFEHIVQWCLGDNQTSPSFTASRMKWQLMKLLPNCLNDPEFSSIAHYIGFDPREEGERRYHLAGQIAGVYDQYLTYRPEIILEWGQSDCIQEWQGRLWQLLLEVLEGYSCPINMMRLTDWSKNIESTAIKGLPERISLFGISAMPPIFIQAVKLISQIIPVHYYLLNPGRYYWGDMLSRREQQRVLRKSKSQHIDYADHHLEEHHPLLVSWGEQWRDYIDLVIETLDDSMREHFIVPNPNSMLHVIQGEILTLFEVESSTIQCDASVAISGDESIKIHRCYSPRREVEALHDNLLRFFSLHQDLTPRDIIVMCPDINEYSTIIEAVFENPEEPGRNIPYSLADRRMRQQSSAVNAFLSILDMAAGRVTGPAIVNLLGITRLQDKFCIKPGELEMVQKWLNETNIRCEVKPHHDYHDHSWEAGLKRILLGYAMGDADEELVQGILPYSRVNENQWGLFDRLLHFVEKLFDFIQIIDHDHGLDEWSRILSAIVEDFLVIPHQPDPDCIFLQRVIGELAVLMAECEFNEAVSFSVIHAEISTSLETAPQSTGFMTGGVTFCRLLPMRNVPFRVVYLLGMNEGIFPRQDAVPSFNLISRYPRPGDRSKRGDDRQIFLEALLSARQYFIISYIGWSCKDNNELPPSIVVSELLDYINDRAGRKAKQNSKQQISESELRSPLLIDHGLHAHYPDYFRGDKGLISYSSSRFASAMNVTNECQPLLTLGEFPLPIPENRERTISITDFCRSCENPARGFLLQRCQVNLDIHRHTLAEREPFLLQGLAGYALKQDLLKRITALDEKEADWLEIYQATGWLPHGNIGVQQYRSVERSINDLSALVSTRLGRRTHRIVEVALTIAGYQINGRIEGIYEDRLVHVVATGIKGKYLLRLWLQQLLLKENGTAISGSELIYLDDGKTKSCLLHVPETSMFLLTDLVHLYEEILSRPVPFFPECALAYVKKYHETGDSLIALKAARKVWQQTFSSGEGYSSAESDDIWMERCFRGLDPINDEFACLAERIMGPLWSAITQK